jgi:DNA-binding transcriptional ArsR family regulator
MRVMRPARLAERPDTEPGGPHFRVAAAYEVLFMLAAAAHPRRHELARGWGAALQRRLSPRAHSTWRAFFGDEGCIGAEPARLVARLPSLLPASSVADFLALLHELPADELLLAFLGDVALTPGVAVAVGHLAQGRAVTAADEAALAVALANRKAAVRSQLRRVLDDPVGTRDAYAALLEEADQHILAAQWPALLPLLEKARVEYSRRYAGLGARQVLETLAGVPGSPIANAGPLVVALSYHAYPFVQLMRGPDHLLLVVGTRGQETEPDPDPGTSRVLKALADATRLRILELIGERPRYVQELADVLDVRHPTVVHHLTLLRQAGLIGSHTEHGTTYYVLHPAMLEDVIAHLRRRLRLDR